MNKGQKNLKMEASQWAEKVFTSLDGMKRAEANPFLFTKIMANLEYRNGGWEKAAGFISRPAFALASILLFIAVNISVIYYGEKTKQDEMAFKRNSEQLLASEFSTVQTYALVESNEEK